MREEDYRIIAYREESNGKVYNVFAFKNRYNGKLLLRMREFVGYRDGKSIMNGALIKR